VKTIVSSVGGGGLLAGMAVAVKAKRPDVRVIGVQAEQAAAYPQSLAAGHPMALGSMSTMADGIAVGCPGEVPYAIVRELVDSVEVVSEEMISRALLFVLERAKLVVEPAGAAAVARLLAAGQGACEGPVVAVLSGGNIDPLLLLRIIRHGMSAAGRYLQFRLRSTPTCSRSSTSAWAPPCTSTRSRSRSSWRPRARRTARRCCGPCAARATS
jgi:threonine dehydratase